MMPDKYDEFLETLNARLDAEATLRLLAFRGDGISVSGRTLKAYCPAHRGEGFKSLQVDLAANRCRCVVRGCPAAQPLDLVEFFAVAAGLPPLAGALRLAREFGIDLPSDLKEALPDEMKASFEGAMHRGDLAEARKAIDILDELHPARPEVTGWRAMLAEKQEGPAAAAAVWVDAAASLAAQGCHGEACGIITDLLENDPNNVDLLALLATYQHEQFRRSATWGETLFRRAKVLLAAGRDEEAREDMARALEVCGKSAPLRAEIGRLELRLGNRTAAVKELWTAAFLHEGEGEEEEALPILEQLIELDPLDVQSREKAAEIRIRLGDLGSYLRYMENLCEFSLEREEESAAELYARKILARSRESAVAHETLAALSEKRGETGAASRHYVAAGKCRGARGETETALAHLERASALGTEGSDNMADLAGALFHLGRREAAVGLFSEAVHSLLELDLPGEAADVLLPLAALNPSPEEILPLLHALAESEEPGAALPAVSRLVDCYLEEDKAVAASSVLESLAPIFGEHADYRSLRLRIVLSGRGDREDAITCLLKCEEEALAREEPAEALDLLRVGRESLPGNALLLERYARLAFAQSRREEALSAWRELLALEDLEAGKRLELGSQAASLAGGGPPFKLLLGLAQWKNGQLADACDLYVDLAEDLLQEPDAAASSPALKHDPHALDEYLVFLAHLLTEGKVDLAQKLKGAISSMLRHSWQRFALLCETVGKHGSAERSIALATRFLGEAQAEERWEDALGAVTHLEAAQPGVARWKETRAHLLAVNGDRQAAAGIWRDLIEAARREQGLQEAVRLARAGGGELPDDPALARLCLEVLLQAEETMEAAGIARSLIDHFRFEGAREEAVTVARMVLVAAPDLYDLRFLLAEDLMETGDLREARAQFRQVGEEAMAGNPPLSRRAFQCLLDMDPESEEVLERLVESISLEEGAEGARHFRERLFEVLAKRIRSGDGEREHLIEELAALVKGDGLNWSLWESHIALLREVREGEHLANALVEYSEALLEERRLDESLAPLQEAEQILPRSLRILTVHAQRLEQLGRLEEAASCWERQVSLARESRKTGDAMQGWSRIARLRPSRPDVLCDYAQFLDEEGEKDEALRLYHQAVEMYTQREEAAECVPILERMRVIDPENLGTWGQLADALAASGEEQRALESRLELAHALVEKGDYRWAATVALQARQENPDSHEARILLSRVYLRQGRIGPCTSEMMGLLPLMIDAGREEEGVALLQSLLHDLMNRKEFAAVLQLLGRFPALASSRVELLHHHALAFEGAGRDQEAAEAWINLAGLVTEGGEHSRAEQSLRRAIALLPQKKYIRLLLADCMKRQGGREAELVEEFHDLAQVALNAGEPAEAVDFLRDVLSIEARDLMALRRLAPLLVELGRVAEAQERYLELGRVALAFDDLEMAESAFGEAHSLDPLDDEALIGLMDLALRAKDIAAHTRHGLELAALYLQTGDRERALALHETIARADPSDRESRTRLIEHFFSIDYAQGAVPLLREIYHIEHDAGEFARAIETLQRIEELDPSDPETLRLLGRLHLEIRDTEQATDYLLQSARNHRARGNIDSAAKVIGEILRFAPWHEDSLRLHATLLEEGGDEAGALASAEKLLEIAVREQDPEKEIDALLAVLRHDPENRERCERIALLYSDLDRNEEAADRFLELSSLHAREGDLSAALDAADTAATLAPDSPLARERLARLCLEAGKASRAAEQFAWLAGHYESTRRPEMALQALQASPSFGDSLPLKLRAAALLEETGRVDEAAGLYREVARGPEAELHRQALGGIVRLDPHDIEAFSGLDKLLRGAGEDSEAEEAAFRVFDSLLSSGEIDGARKVEEAALDASPHPITFLEQSARHYEEHGLPELAAGSLREAAFRREEQHPEDALRLIDTALVLKPWDSAAKELRFRLLEHLGLAERIEDAGADLLSVHLSRGDRKGAREIARRMIRLQPDEPSHRARLLDLLAGEGTEESRERVAVLAELADLHLRREETEEALDCLRGILRLDPEDVETRRRYIDIYRQVGPETDLPLDYLRLARALGRKGETLEASKTYEKALELDPSNGELHKEFIDFLLGVSQVGRAVSQSLLYAGHLIDEEKGREALAILEGVAGAAGDDPAYHLSLGRAHLALNARGAGVKELRRAAQLYRDAGAHGEEAAVLARVCAEDPFNLEARQMLIDAHLGAGEAAEAVSASLALAATYKERSLPDLALAEFRRVLLLDPENEQGWRGLFDTADAMGVEEDLVEDYLEYADLVATKGQAQEAVEHYRRVMRLDPHNLRAHRGFVIQYPKIGAQRDIVEEMLTFSQLLVDVGELDEAIRYFELVMSINPQNTRARDMLSATRSRAEKLAQAPHRPPAPSPSASQAMEKGFLRDEQRLTETQKRFIYQSSSGAEAFLQSEIGDAPAGGGGEGDALSQVIANYRNILEVNAANAEVRLRLAEVLGQTGRESEMIEEMLLAAEALYKKSDLEQCIGVCTRILDKNPANPRARRLLNEAEIKRDAISALDSTISFINLDTGAAKRKRTD